MGGANYLREIVSGKKARFIDHETATNLDLVYVTDRILIMGWPAIGLASYYRNRRRDVLKFINSRHGEKWWIWNLCPLYENAYSPESMHNRVSRYPFPDHHPPPLPLLPLAAREMTAWLEGDPERVAIIHCKAGKGRSGTLLCSYMLSLAELPPPPQLDKSYSSSDLAQRTSHEAVSGTEVTAQDRDGWVVVGSGDAVAEIPVVSEGDEAEGSATPARSERVDVPSPSAKSSFTTLSRSSTMSGEVTVTTEPEYDPIDIGDEASAGSEGQRDRGNGKVDAVFKLHSSRRMKPSSTGRGVSIPSQRRWIRYVNLLFSHQAPPTYTSPQKSRVRLASVTLYLAPPATWQRPLTHLIVGGDAGRGKAWASVARYDDDYVSELRHRGGQGEGLGGSVTWGGVAGDGRYESTKMFRSFAKMVAAPVPPELEHNHKVVHHLRPEGDEPLVLERARECRLKFHLGSLPLGWAWLIPAFHLKEPTPPTTRTHTLRFPRSQLDFPLGPGQAVEEILVQIEEVPDEATDSPARLLTDEEERQQGLDDARHEGSRLDEVEGSER